MSRNEAAERLFEWLTLFAEQMPETAAKARTELDEALVTERRLTVERVREAVREIADMPPYMSEHDARQLYVEALGRARSILDDLATADVDEEAGDG